ncbi:MAG: B12-binding domain-containing radical SAM protein, partial [Planctomycetota bacterium]
WEEADLICVGGMLTQQPGILEVIERAKRSGKYVVVGGADASSQPEVYVDADARVLGEGELSVPIWLESWRNGKREGVFEAGGRPDVKTTPIPRFELLNFADYVHIGVQFSRGCPFNCEFCDIIELYGRVPRSKTAEQFMAELEYLYQLGYRGWVDVVDDNFIGNKPIVKPMLDVLEKWSRERKFPFYFSTEATMNLADDADLLKKMQAAEFRFVFMGIETPDPELLALTQKRVNSMKPIVERVRQVYEHGISVTAGFIFGFDSEKPGNDHVMTECIEQTGIVVAMVGLLVALPNTQLTRRLQREGRLLSPELKLVTDNETPYRIMNKGQYGEGEDNQATGLNFVTTRDRVEVYREYKKVLETIYSPKNFMDRVLDTTRRLKLRRRRKPGWWETKRELRGLLSMMWWMTRDKSVRRYYWRNSFRSLLMGFDKFDAAQTMMMSYMHFKKQSRHVVQQLDINIDFAIHRASYPRMMEPASGSAQLTVVRSEP